MKAREASARFLTQYGVEPGGGGGVIQRKFEYDTEKDIRAVAKGGGGIGGAAVPQDLNKPTIWKIRSGHSASGHSFVKFNLTDGHFVLKTTVYIFVWSLFRLFRLRCLIHD